MCLNGNNKQGVDSFEEVTNYFLIRNEENYINRRKETRERRATRESKENKRRMRGPSHKNKN